jgi:outer membrane protein OmpA-like peptidoglycan-associated protein
MLGGVSEERETLIQRIEAQARIKEQYERVEKIFLPEEARVLRENNNVILRLIGLTFESNESKIMTKNIPLLTKVEKAIDVYPKREIIIEGHTDSQGDDQFNQNLSQERADSIKQYMINAMLIPNYRIIATGYGETRPIANNETALGRQKNRRIDVVISSIVE